MRVAGICKRTFFRTTQPYRDVKIAFVKASKVLAGRVDCKTRCRGLLGSRGGQIRKPKLGRQNAFCRSCVDAFSGRLVDVHWPTLP